MLSDWMYRAPNPGLSLVALGLLLGLLGLATCLRKPSRAAGLLAFAGALSFVWGLYTATLTQKLVGTPAGVLMPVRAGTWQLLAASMVSVVLMLGILTWLARRGRNFQAVFTSVATICMAACSAYQWQLWLLKDEDVSRLKVTVAALETTAGVALVFGLIVAQVMLFVELHKTQSHVDYWARTAGSLQSELEQARRSQRVTTEVVRMDHA